MKKFILLAIISFIIACSPQKSESIKVMTWNIWHGGLHGDKASNFEKDTANTINILKVIQQHDPDVLLMQETYCCGMEIAAQAEYPFSARASSNLSIHSKYPILDTINIYRPFNSQGLILDVNGEKILFVNVWLHYLPDFFEDIKQFSPDSLIAGEGTTRLKEIKAILNSVDSISKELNIPVIIGGDFNSGSHLDWTVSTKEFHYGKVVEWPVSKFMTDNGYTDSFREANPDPLKTMDGTWGFLNGNIISDRIDFIYYKGDNIKTNHSQIVLEDPEDGFFNSDHRAILSIIEVAD